MTQFFLGNALRNEFCNYQTTLEALIVQQRQQASHFNWTLFPHEAHPFYTGVIGSDYVTCVTLLGGFELLDNE